MATINLLKISADTYIKRPGAGIEGWHNESAAVFEKAPLDNYQRFVTTRLEGPNRGSYNWSYFDSLVENAKAKGQKLSFGLMTHYPDGSTSYGLARYSDGSLGAVPEHVHNAMQKEPIKDWKKGNVWVPNYNSAYYHEWLLELHKALNKHIYEKGYEKYIYVIDVRGYGDWGEWNSSATVSDVNQYPAGTFPTAASLKKIVDAHTQGFPDFPLVAMIAGFDAQWLRNVWNPAEIAHYLLTTKNNWGLLGWRRDQWGQGDQYLKDYLENNNRSYNGVVFKNLIMDRYRFAPITGEPMPSGNPMSDLPRQVALYHATSFGDGNYGSVSDQATLKKNVGLAAAAAGYKLQIDGGTYTNTNTAVSVTINWKNIGGSPTYEDWMVKLRLKNSAGQVVVEKESSFRPKLFLGSLSVTDDIPVNAPAGNYSLSVLLETPGRNPMPLYNEGRAADGSYNLGTVTISGTQPVPNQPPVVEAGANQTITLPTDTVQLAGSATDNDGTISKVLWEIQSGSGLISNPSILSPKLEGLSEGTTVVRLTATDDDGATASDTVAIKVNPKPVEPQPEKKLVDIKVSLKTETTYTAVYDDGSNEVIVK